MASTQYPAVPEEQITMESPQVARRVRATVLEPLADGFTVEIDQTSSDTWAKLVEEFEDASIYQTRPYAKVLAGKTRVSDLVLRKNGRVVAIAQARLVTVPVIGAGVAYVRWGPLWRRKSIGADVENFRQAVRALRNEYVCKRKLVLRVFPAMFREGGEEFERILLEEGLSSTNEAPGRTILMDLRPSVDELRDGMKAHWRRELKVAEKRELEVLEGTSNELFDEFIVMYKEMVSRKNFVEPNDIYQFRKIQADLPEALKMRILLCRADGVVCSGLICSALGNSAVYLFGATSDFGMKSRGSYLLQWRLLPWLQAKGIETYNLNGINPVANPGTFKFKDDLAGSHGTDAYYLGRYDAGADGLSAWCLDLGQSVRKTRRGVKAFLARLKKKKNG
ncbi:MAG: hypothetical protein ABIR70_14510 [Bryobacteraceae bacterium]